MHYLLLSLLFKKHSEDILPPPPPFPNAGQAKEDMKTMPAPAKSTPDTPVQGLHEQDEHAAQPMHEVHSVLPEPNSQEDVRLKNDFEHLERTLSKLKEANQATSGKSPLTRMFAKKPPQKELEMPDARPGQVDEVSKAIEDAKQHQRKTKKPFGFFRKKKKEISEPDMATPDVMPKTWDKPEPIHDMEDQIHKARLALMEFKFDEAKKIYLAVMQSYNELSEKDQARIYYQVKDLYDERKAAEKFGRQ